MGYWISTYVMHGVEISHYKGHFKQDFRCKNGHYNNLQPAV